MKYNIMKIALVTNSVAIAAAFLYYAIQYANWDLIIITFCLFLMSIIVILIYNSIENLRQKELTKLSNKLNRIEVQARKMLEEKKAMIVREPHYVINNKAENDQKRFSNSYPSLSHIGEDEHDELTECERTYRNYLNKQPSEN